MYYDGIGRGLEASNGSNNTIIQSLQLRSACSQKVVWFPSSSLAGLQVTYKELFFDHFSKISNSEEPLNW